MVPGERRAFVAGGWCGAILAILLMALSPVLRFILHDIPTVLAIMPK